MRLVPFDIQRLSDLMRWFPDDRSCRIWGGPHFRLPFERGSFRADARVDSMRSWSLESEDDRMLAFGQYYTKAGRCHLARLAVAPAVRGQGLGETLIRELCIRARADLGTANYSLYVMEGNDVAMRLYQRLGFVVTEAPEVLPRDFGPILFMVADGEAANALARCDASARTIR